MTQSHSKVPALSDHPNQSTAPGLMAASQHHGAPDSGYRLPPAPLQAIVDAPRAPALSLSPRRDTAAVVQTPALPAIADVAQQIGRAHV